MAHPWRPGSPPALEVLRRTRGAFGGITGGGFGALRVARLRHKTRKQRLKNAGSRNSSVISVPASTKGVKSKVPDAPSEKRSRTSWRSFGSIEVSLITAPSPISRIAPEAARPCPSRAALPHRSGSPTGFPISRANDWGLSARAASADRFTSECGCRIGARVGSRCVAAP